MSHEHRKGGLPSSVRSLLWACCLAVAACAPPDEQELNPVEAQAEELGQLRGFLRAKKPVPNRYIVLFDESAPGISSKNAAEIAQEMTLSHGGKVVHVYRHVFPGYLAEMNSQTAEKIARNPQVKLVAEDEEVTLSSVQEGATWGLDRIDERWRLFSGAYQQPATGQGVHVYVVDSGILTGHTEFGGRVSGGISLVVDGRGTSDCNGHGTHVAGTIGGATYGVAKGVFLHPVRVFGCTATSSNGLVIAAIDWVTITHTKPAVVNMSLGSLASPLLDDAVRRSIAAGITYVVAAGNDNANACNYSPARVTQALTVGATHWDDTRAEFSNWGSCLDLFAPGTYITSAGIASVNATADKSGTSMAAPHVAGVAALYLQRNPQAPPAQVHQAILSASTQGMLSGALNGSPNRLLYSLFVQGEPRFITSKLWTSNFSDAEGWANSDSYYDTIQTGDLNGDGVQDICGRSWDGVRCSLSYANGFTYASLWQPLLSDAGGWKGYPSTWGTLQLADVNGDGMADLCMRASNGVGCALSEGFNFGDMYLWTTNFSDAENTHSQPSYWKTLRFPDVNGDGLADVCARGPEGMMCGLSTGAGFAPVSNWEPLLGDAYGWGSSPAYWSTLQFPDLNGDKKADVCIRASTGVACSLSTGSGFQPLNLWTTGFRDELNWGSNAAYYQTVQFPDLNGDGRADICGRGAAGVWCATSTGVGFGTLTLWTIGYRDSAGWASSPAYWETLRFPDINGDGKADVCARGAASIVCGLSDGNVFGLETAWSTQYSDAAGWATTPALWKTLRFMDLNQDGRMDLCGRSSTGLLCSLSAL